MVQFFGVVDTTKFVLTDNPNIGLNDVTRNSSAIFMAWSKFPDLESGVMPEPGWYANYVYAMLPRTKAHLTKKCEGYKADSTPFRKHGRKAYVRGYMHGFCNKAYMFAPDSAAFGIQYSQYHFSISTAKPTTSICTENIEKDFSIPNTALAPDARPSTLEFVPFIEIMEIDWASSDTKASVQDIPATPSKTNVKSDIASSKRKRKRKIGFDPFADAGIGSSLTFEKILEPKSDSLSRTTTAGYSEDLEDDFEAINTKQLGRAMTESHDDVNDEPSPSKKPKLETRGKGAKPKRGV
ncbi:hypothetical protein V8E54_006806 [Elaphomyces granulatus]